MKTYRKRVAGRLTGKRRGLAIACLVLLAASPFPLAEASGDGGSAGGDLFHDNQALTLAEAGLDEAMSFLNSRGSDGWTIVDNEARFSAGALQIGRGATGEIEVLVEDYAGTPVVSSEGRVVSEIGLAATRQLRMTVRRPFGFGQGLLAGCRIRLDRGTVIMESYRSSQGFVQSPQYKRRDRITVAAMAIESSIHLGNGHVWGYAFTGGGFVDFGPEGSVQGEDSEPLPRIDPKRVGRDFQAAFPPPPPEPAPLLSGPTIELEHLRDWIDEQDWSHRGGVARTVDDYVDAANMARVATAEEPDLPGTYIVNYGTIFSPTTLGIPAGMRVREDGGSHPDFAGRLVVYADRIVLSGVANDLRIVGPVTLVVAGDVSISGGARLVIGYDDTNHEDASLILHTMNDIHVSGSGGMRNFTRLPGHLAILGGAADPENACLYTQRFVLGGNNSWEAVIYAPNADITLTGGGSSGFMAGAVAGMNLTVLGGSRFHYDEDTEELLRTLQGY